MATPPSTLPANFFDAAPSRLPADFDFTDHKAAALTDLKTPPSVEHLPSQAEFDDAHRKYVGGVMNGIRGLDQLGGQLPAMPSAPNAITQPAAGAPDFVQAAYEGKYGIPAPPSLGTAFEQPAANIEGGVERIANAHSGRDVAGGASQAIRGGLGVVSGPESLGPMIAAAPVGAAVSMGGAALAQKGTEAGLKAAGVPPEYSNLAGDVAGLLAGAGGAAYLMRRAYVAAGSPEVKVGGKFAEPKPFADMTDEELVNQANAIEKDRPKNYEFQRKEIVKEAAQRQAGRGMAAGDVPPEPEASAHEPAPETLPPDFFENAQAPSEATTPPESAGSTQPAPRTPASEAQAAPTYPTGRTATVKTPRGTRVDVQYAVVDAAQPVASHDLAGEENPDYPQERQPRDRGRKASQAQITAMASTLDPEELGANPRAGDGAPITDKNLVVESGNGRTNAIRLAYERYPERAQAYRDFVTREGAAQGIDPAATAKMAQPMLIRVRQGDLDPVQFAREANEPTTAAMSAAEQAASDARTMSPALMSAFEPSENGDVDHAANDTFIRGFMDQIANPAERSRYMTSTGELSQEGVTRMRNAVFARAYGDTTALEKMAESTDSNIRNLTGGMLRAAPAFVKMQAGIDAGDLHDVSITPDVAAAAAKISALRQQGRNVQDYLNQNALFDNDLTDESRNLVDVFARYSRSAKKVGDVLHAYSDAVEAAGSPKQESFFGSIKPTKAELLQAAIATVQSQELPSDKAAPRGDADQTAGSAAASPAAVRQGPPARGPGDHEVNDEATGATRAREQRPNQIDRSAGGAERTAAETGGIEPRLPKLLAGAKPRYNFGSKAFTLDFESDVDRAAYIAAQEKPSKQDSAYMAFVRKATGKGPIDVRLQGARVKAAIKEQAANAAPGTLRVERGGRVYPVEAASGKIRFMRPFPDRPMKAGASPLETAKDAMLVHRPGKRGEHGILYANRQAIEILTRYGGIADNPWFWGMWTDPVYSKRVISDLNRAILSRGVRMAPPLIRLRNTFKKAAADPAGVVLVDAGTGRQLSQVKATARHELHHAYETELEPEQATGFLEDPLARIAGRALVDRKYPDDPVELVSEIAAHLVAGPLDWKKMGIQTVEQAAHLWGRYLSYRPGYSNRRIHPVLLKDAHAADADHSQRPEDPGELRPPDADSGGKGRRSIRERVPEDVQRQRADRGTARGVSDEGRLSGPLEGAAESHADQGREGPLLGRSDLFADSFYPEAQREAEVSAQRKLEGDRLTAQFKSGMALKSRRKGKGPPQTDLFKETPEEPQRSLFGDERGGIHPDLMTLGAAKFAREDVAPALAKAARGIVDAKDGIQRILAPASRGPLAQLTALALRHRGAEQARRFDQARAALKAAYKYFDSQSASANLDFIDRVEHGRAQPGIHQQAIANTMRELLDGRREDVHALGAGQLRLFYENYFPHIWDDPAKAADLAKRFYAKRSLEGSKAFLEARSFPTIKDGVDAGLKPASSNPVDLALRKIREMDKYITAHRAINDMREAGIVKFVPTGGEVPKGYERIKDKVATAMVPAKEGGTQEAGGYYVPEQAAQVINNYLSPGLRDQAKGLGPVFRAYLGAANVLNQAQLGLSAFHASFTTVETMVSRFALGTYQAAHGKPLQGLGTMASTPLAPLRTLRQGARMQREWDKPGSEDAATARLVEAFEQAGGRARMDDFYRTDVARKMVQAWRSGNWIGAGLRLPMAAIEKSVAPVMEWLVPRQKMGVFADMARFELERLGVDATDPDAHAALAKAWDSVENRLGQLTYDNLFWDRTAKDLAMATFRSVGWNIGTIREVAGGGVDAAKFIRDAAAGKHPDFTHRMAYIVGAVSVLGTLGALWHYLSTGERPAELRDYYFPRSGPRGTQGWNRRVSMPGYAKDAASWAHQPAKTLRGKIHPLASLIWEEMSNEDFFGRPIRNEDDPFLRALEKSAVHAGQAFEPFAVRNPVTSKRGPKETDREKVERMFGVTRAPGFLQGGKPKHRKAAR